MRILFLVTAILVFASCAQNEKQQAGPSTSSSLHYRLSGQGKTTLLFLHGWGINGSYWDGQTARFKDSFRILAPDLSGHGQSRTDSPTMSMEKYATEIAAMVNELKLDQIILIGHSMSGNIGLRVYEKIPEKIIGFIGIDNLQKPGAVPSETEMKQIDSFFIQMKADYPSMTRNYALAALFCPVTDSLVKQRVVNDMTGMNPGIAISALQSLVKEYKAEQRILPTLKIPLLLITAEQNKVDEDALKKYCGSGYRYWTIKNTGHYPMIEQSLAFDSLLNLAIQACRR